MIFNIPFHIWPNKNQILWTETIFDWRTGQELSVREASDLLSISVDELLKYYAGQREISLRNLLKRICRSNPIYHFPIIGEPTYTLKGVMDATGKGRSWSLVFLERNCVRTWCLGVHYLYAMIDVDSAWRKESIMYPSSNIFSR